MRRSRLALLALFASSSALLACAAAEPLPPPAPALVLLPAPPPPPPPLPAPQLLVIPRAEASPRGVPRVQAPPITPLRAEGKQHALERTEDGIVLISAERGVLGVVKASALGAPIRWAGFVDDDAVLLATASALHRAATPDDAIAGKLEALEKIDPAATLVASADKVVVAVVPGPDGAYYESRDGGRHFTAGKRPAKGAVVDVAVRSDGVIVAAIEEQQVKNARGKSGVRAQLVSAKRPGAWTAGPLAQTFYGPVLTHHGDSIVVLSPKKQVDENDILGLDAKGRWIPTDFPERWLPWTWSDGRVSIGAPSERPGFPGPPSGRFGALSGLMMGGGGGRACAGVSCLGHRAALGPPPIARAFRDGVCAKENVEAHTEPLANADAIAGIGGLFGVAKSAPKEKTTTTYECNKSAPAQRASTLLLRDGDERRVARLPNACASGEITGSGRASFVYCNAEHQGRPSILHVSPTGAFTEVASGIAGNLDILGAESASDGTTVIFAPQAAWICGVAAPACVSVPHDRFLAARPLPAGRALVARSTGEHDLQLEVFGEPGAQPLRLAVNDNVLEIETTAEGFVRLWTSRTSSSLSSPASLARAKGEPAIEAFLVRSDGQLIPDAAAKEAFLREVAAARAAR